MFSAMGLAARARSHRISVGPAMGSHQMVCLGDGATSGRAAAASSVCRGPFLPLSTEDFAHPCAAAGSLPRPAPTATRAVGSNSFEGNFSVSQQIMQSPNPTSCPGCRERCAAMRWIWERGRFLWSRAQARNELIAGLSLGMVLGGDGPDLLSQGLLGS